MYTYNQGGGEGVWASEAVDGAVALTWTEWMAPLSIMSLRHDMTILCRAIGFAPRKLVADTWTCIDDDGAALGGVLGYHGQISGAMRAAKKLIRAIRDREHREFYSMVASVAAFYAVVLFRARPRSSGAPPALFGSSMAADAGSIRERRRRSRPTASWTCRWTSRASARWTASRRPGSPGWGS